MKVKTVDYTAMRVHDLTGLESSRLRVRGTFNYIADTKRDDVLSREFVLVREPDNEYDSSAIAIYSKQRMIGHVSASKASRLAPLLDELGSDGAVVHGAADNEGTMLRFFVDLPTVPALRAFVNGLS